MAHQRTKSAFVTISSLVDMTLGRFLLSTVLLLCLLLHNDAVSSQSPTEERDIVMEHRRDGKDSIITCTVRDLGSRRVIWTRLSDPYPISVGGTRFTPSKKYKIDVQDNTYTLTVKNVELKDAGEYQCRVTGQVLMADTITLNIQSSTGSTYLLPSDTQIRATVGDTVTLPCHVENMHDNLALWKNDRNEILTLRKKVYSGDRRMSVVHLTRPEWSLEIKNIKESDFGLYTCIINSEPVLTRTVELKNSAPAQTAPVLLLDSHFKKRITVDAGETVTLTCNFRSNPPSEVTWYRRKSVDGKTVKEAVGKGNTFTMQEVTAEQSGNYICMGRNSMKPAGRGKTRLIVKAAVTTTTTTTVPTTFIPDGPVSPHMYRDHPDAKVIANRGYDVVLKCSSIAFPRPNIHWRRHQTRISDNMKYKITDTPSGRYGMSSELSIRSVSSGDFGDYVCTGYNQLGLKTINITVSEN